MTKYPIQDCCIRIGIGCNCGDGGVFGIALPSDKETTLPVESGKEPFDRSTPPAASREAMRRTALPALPVHSTSRHDSLICPDLSGDLSGTYPAINSKSCPCHMSIERAARFTERRGLFPPVPGRRCLQFLKLGRYCGSMSPGKSVVDPTEWGISLRAA